MRFVYTTLANEHVGCNLCGDTNGQIFANSDRYGFPVTARFCTVCGLVYISPRMSAESYAWFYDSGIYRELPVQILGQKRYTPDEQAEHQERYNSLILPFLEPFIPPGKIRVLDIGGSVGSVSTAILRTHDATGIVLDPAGKELAEVADTRLTTVKGQIETWETDEQFDVVLLCQTVDHLLDIAGVLTKIRRLLKPDGVFFVDIVDFESLVKQNRYAHLAVKLDHPFGLTRLVMFAFLHRDGFKVVNAGEFSDKSKRLFVCKVDERRDVLPAPESVEQLRRVIQRALDTYGRLPDRRS